MSRNDRPRCGGALTSQCRTNDHDDVNRPTMSVQSTLARWLAVKRDTITPCTTRANLRPHCSVRSEFSDLDRSDRGWGRRPRCHTTSEQLTHIHNTLSHHVWIMYCIRFYLLPHCVAARKQFTVGLHDRIYNMENSPKT